MLTYEDEGGYLKYQVLPGILKIFMDENHEGELKTWLFEDP